MKDPIMKAAKATEDRINRAILESFVERLEDEHIQEIKDIILQEYDMELTGRVTDRKSKTNPIYYRDEFALALDEFNWLSVESKQSGKLTTPAMNNFPWHQGRLRVIENILEGTIGNFMEVDEEQYLAMFERRPVVQPFDKTVPRRERVYLLKVNGDIRRRWQNAYGNEQWVRYPFSNQPPIDIFAAADQYVLDNMQGWINDAVKEITKRVGK
jgi:hypothetical protein